MVGLVGINCYLRIGLKGVIAVICVLDDGEGEGKQRTYCIVCCMRVVVGLCVERKDLTYLACIKPKSR